MLSAKEKRNAARKALATLDLSVSAATTPDTRPRTAPGLLMKNVGINSELEAENASLKEEVAKWDGDAHTRKIDTALIDNSRLANRHSDAFSTKEFLELKSNIEQSGGNVQPIKVRQKADGRYEVVYGHRRTRACHELGLPVLALIAEAMSEADLFVEMDRENRTRADLSPWEQGVMFQKALEFGLFPSARRLAESVGVDVSTVTRNLKVATLPKEVVRCFGSPLDITYRIANELNDAIERDPSGVLARASALLSENRKLPLKSLVATLLGLGEARGPGPLVKLSVGGSEVGKLKRSANGKISIEIEPSAMAVEREAELVELLEKFLSRAKR